MATTIPLILASVPAGDGGFVFGDGAGGLGGDAISQALATASGDSSLSAFASASGGNGGGAFFFGSGLVSGGNGGNATSNVTASAANQDSNVVSVTSAGNGRQRRRRFG